MSLEFFVAFLTKFHSNLYRVFAYIWILCLFLTESFINRSTLTSNLFGAFLFSETQGLWITLGVQGGFVHGIGHRMAPWIGFRNGQLLVTFTSFVFRAKYSSFSFRSWHILWKIAVFHAVPIYIIAIKVLLFPCGYYHVITDSTRWNWILLCFSWPNNFLRFSYQGARAAAQNHLICLTQRDTYSTPLFLYIYLCLSIFTHSL